MNPICDLYCRVSTSYQASEGYSIGEQEELLKHYAAANGWVVNAVHIDPGFTGKNMMRPGLQKVIEDVQKKKVNKVCVYKLDRLSRSQKETLYLIEDVFLANGCDFVSMTEQFDTGTPLGRLMLGILSAYNQLEREQIRERMMLGRSARAKEGYYKGGGNIPIGYRYDATTGCLNVDDYEAEMVRKVFDMYKSGETGSGIAKKLNLEYQFRDRKWSSSNVTRMLRNPVYIGEMRWNGELIKIKNHTNIISRETFDQVQEILERRCADTKEGQTPYKHKALLGGLIWCARCGIRYSAQMNGRDKVIGLYRYYCQNRLAHGRLYGIKCSNDGWRADVLDGIVLDEIRKLAADHSLVNEIANGRENKDGEISALKARIAVLDEQTNRLIDLYAKGILDPKAIEKKASEIGGERKSLQDKLDALLKTPTHDLKDVYFKLDTFEDLVENAEEQSQLSEIVHSLIRRIDLDGQTVKITWMFE